MGRVIGIGMIVALFAGLYITTAQLLGWRLAAKIFIGTAIVLGWTFLAAYMVAGG